MPRSNHHQKHSKSSPPGLQLEAFFKKAVVVPSRSVAQRSNPVVGNAFSSLRAMELEHMENQFPSEKCYLVKESEEESTYAIDFRPLDPEWV